MVTYYTYRNKKYLRNMQINVYEIKIITIVLKYFILRSLAYINSNFDLRNFMVNTDRIPQASEERRQILPWKFKKFAL